MRRTDCDCAPCWPQHLTGEPLGGPGVCPSTAWQWIWTENHSFRGVRGHGCNCGLLTPQAPQNPEFTGHCEPTWTRLLSRPQTPRTSEHQRDLEVPTAGWHPQKPQLRSPEAADEGTHFENHWDGVKCFQQQTTEHLRPNVVAPDVYAMSEDEGEDFSLRPATALWRPCLQPRMSVPCSSLPLAAPVWGLLRGTRTFRSISHTQRRVGTASLSHPDSASPWVLGPLTLGVMRDEVRVQPPAAGSPRPACWCCPCPSSPSSLLGLHADEQGDPAPAAGEDSHRRGQQGPGRRQCRRGPTDLGHRTSWVLRAAKNSTQADWRQAPSWGEETRRRSPWASAPGSRKHESLLKPTQGSRGRAPSQALSPQGNEVLDDDVHCGRQSGSGGFSHGGGGVGWHCLDQPRSPGGTWLLPQRESSRWFHRLSLTYEI
ncbi:uncharacterized protein LOC135322754 [Camelus dromedarius]|uniref:uncharacterized protein LOC135322754 n=1 Tax=Camelus dromedarius TaxID=9838 RepID=UPI003119390D